MKHFSIGLLAASLTLATVAANADGMGRLHGYAQGPGASSKSLSLSTAVVIDEKKKIENHGRLSAYDMPQRASAGQRETMPVLAGMKHSKSVGNTDGLGRLNGYGEEVEEVADDLFNIFDTTNMAVWY